jgi:hypothetical protein
MHQIPVSRAEDAVNPSRSWSWPPPCIGYSLDPDATHLPAGPRRRGEDVNLVTESCLMLGKIRDLILDPAQAWQVGIGDVSDAH